MLPGSAGGLRYLFVPDWGLLLSGRVWLEAFTHAAWFTGAGWGLLLVYAAYAKAKEAVGVNCTIIGFAGVLAGFVAVIAVLSTIYALSPSIELAEEALAAGNVGLNFIIVKLYLLQIFCNCKPCIILEIGYTINDNHPNPKAALSDSKMIKNLKA